MREYIHSVFLDGRSPTYKKAKRYKPQVINRQYYIVPDSDEIEEVCFDTTEKRNSYLGDFLDLLKAISDRLDGFRRTEEVIEQVFEEELSHEKIPDEEKYQSSLLACAKKLASFYSKWGPFDIMESRVLYTDKQTFIPEDPINGYGAVLVLPNYSLSVFYMNLLPHDILPTGVHSDHVISRHFFPKLEKIGPLNIGLPTRGSEEFFKHYCEPVLSVLGDASFCKMLMHYEKVFLGIEREIIDNPMKENEDQSTKDILNTAARERLDGLVLGANSVNLEAVKRDSEWKLNASGGPRISFTFVLYILNLLKTDEYVAVCKHTTCHKSFVADNPRTLYCCRKHAENAKKMRYRKKQEANEPEE